MKLAVITAVLSTGALVNAVPNYDCRPNTVTEYSTQTKVDYNTKYSTQTVVVSYTAPPSVKSITATVSATVSATVTVTSRPPPYVQTVTVTSTTQQPAKTVTVTSTAQEPAKTVTQTTTSTVTASCNDNHYSGGNVSGQCNAIACCDSNSGKCTQTDKACSNVQQETRCCNCSSSNGLINVNAACCNEVATFDQVTALLGVVVGGLGIHT